jgi:hypothetical protein
MVRAVKSHFETPETRQKYLSDLRDTTLTKVIQSNRDKTKLECLELRIEKLRKITKGLGKNEEELREQLLNACEAYKNVILPSSNLHQTYNHCVLN